jgi:hypothetical protein
MVVVWVLGLCLAGSAADFPRGRVVEKVPCLDDAAQGYALYLPSNYSKDKTWAILYCFEPGARGTLPVNLFKQAAETHGYIVVCSNNSRNGPWEPIKQAALAMWKDTRKRFSIDESRIYAAGFSGGARVASHFPFIIGRPIAGVIGCGAGLSTVMKPGMLKQVLYFGIVGLEDFNYRELIKLDKTFDDTEVVHRVLVFDGPHRWPPREDCTRALEWMEVNAMKQGRRVKDVLLVTRLYKKNLLYAMGLEKQGRVFEAVLAYEGAAALFNGLLDNREAGAKGKALKESNAYKDFLAGEETRRKKQAGIISAFVRVRDRLKQNPFPKEPETLIKSLKLAALKKEARREEGNINIYDRALLRRLLDEIRVNVVSAANMYMNKKDYARAAVFYEMTLEVGFTHRFIYYNLACAHSRLKNKKKALKYLQQSVENGYNDLDHLFTDPDLEYIRKEKKFKAIVKQVRGGRQ